MCKVNYKRIRYIDDSYGDWDNGMRTVNNKKIIEKECSLDHWDGWLQGMNIDGEDIVQIDFVNKKMSRSLKITIDGNETYYDDVNEIDQSELRIITDRYVKRNNEYVESDTHEWELYGRGLNTVKFLNCDFTDSSLSGIEMEDCRFLLCDLKNVVFNCCYFTDVRFEMCDMSGVIFKNCIFELTGEGEKGKSYNAVVDCNIDNVVFDSCFVESISFYACVSEKLSLINNRFFDFADFLGNKIKYLDILNSDGVQQLYNGDGWNFESDISYFNTKNGFGVGLDATFYPGDDHPMRAASYYMECDLNKLEGNLQKESQEYIDLDKKLHECWEEERRQIAEYVDKNTYSRDRIFNIVPLKEKSQKEYSEYIK